ncbi:carbohydrate ABC transporter permease [Lachnoclostridium phytofermentans]|uniref:carbohydrate ABC transporter permease n=1 Tax=Lachnoclostridium phytofermentans TaxID=66219 RepID=UPI00068927E2|nr:sugar ABC transporter permease [Lachnoclostridium phytofermentans]
MRKAQKVKKVKLGKLAKREARMGYIFVLPWIIGAVLFLIVPLIQSFQYSLADIKITPKGMKIDFVAFENFTQIWLEDAEYPLALGGYFWETILSVPIIVVFALLIAMFLNQKIRCKGLFRLIFFLPVIIVSGPVMNMLSSQGAATIPSMNVAAIRSALEGFLPYYIASGFSDVFSNMIMILWYSGVQILIFLSALQKIDSSLYEAAKIDGGSGWECFWKITLPTIKPMILLNAVYTVIFLSNNEQNNIINIIQNAMFAGNKGYGYASAMAWMYAIVQTIIVAIVAVLLLTRKDAYDKQVKRRKKELRKQNRTLRRIRRRNRRKEKSVSSLSKSKGNVAWHTIRKNSMTLGKNGGEEHEKA